MGGDFHWHRLDNNGIWSHKPGKTRATNLDNANRPITDPRTADTGLYEFVCFMTAGKDVFIDETIQQVNISLEQNMGFLGQDGKARE